MYFNYERAKQDIVQVGKELYQKGLLIGTDGNISIRMGQNEILITASGVCKGKMGLEHVTLVDMEGNIIRGMKPARDIRMHLAVYRERPEAKAIVHAHPPITTGYAMCEVDFSKVALPEVFFTLQNIATTNYTTPTTIEVPREITRVLSTNKVCQAILLANHGALTIGTDVYDAFYKMETFEMFLKANLVSKIVGKTRYLDENQMKKVNRLLDGEAPDSVVSPYEMAIPYLW